MVANSDKHTDDYQPTLPFPSDLWSILVFFSSLFWFYGPQFHGFDSVLQLSSLLFSAAVCSDKAPTTHCVLHQTTANVSDYLRNTVEPLAPKEPNTTPIMNAALSVVSEAWSYGNISKFWEEHYNYYNFWH